MIEVAGALVQQVLTMGPKCKINLTNHSRYQFQHLLRHYQQAVEQTNSGEYLQPPDIFRVLDAMGYLCPEKTEKDYELINSLTFMLAHPKGQAIVTLRNLFQFLLVINHLQADINPYFEKQVQPLPKDLLQLEHPLIQIDIGSHDASGNWTVTKEEEAKLRQIFSNMIYTRVSRQDIHARKRKENEVSNNNEEFKPKILNKSVILAENRIKKLNVGKKVEDRLLHGRDEFNNRLYVEIKASLQKQVKECTFKPRINSRSKQMEREDSFAKEEVLLQKGREYELRRKMHREEYDEFKQSMERSQCSFHPDLSNSTSSLRHSLKREFNPLVKNQDKSIERMKLAREERESLNEVNRRGYPEGKSWVNFMEQVRTKRTRTQPYHNISTSTEKPVIFTMDLKILGEQKHIQVKEADDILEMTQRICQNHSINTENYQKVYDIIEKTLRQSGEALIKNGRVFLLKRK